MWRKFIGYGLVGACTYVTLDACGDALMYLKAKQLVADKALGNSDFIRMLGGNDHSMHDAADKIQDSTSDRRKKKSSSVPPSFSFGPWYDSSVHFTHGGMVVTVQMPCRGPERASDITMRAIRKHGFRWTLLHNVTNGEWDIVMLDALVGMGGGGQLVSMSLLDRVQKEEQEIHRTNSSDATRSFIHEYHHHHGGHTSQSRRNE